MGTFRVQWIDADGLAVSTYSRYAPVKLSKPLVSVLHTFDGSATTDTLVRMRKAGIEIEPQLIRTLVDFNVLVPTFEPARPRLEPHD